ncbi:MAG: AMP-binding protein, partial [Deltaproteobacteria bacterium]|nr:AMP-binding protein [Deltaproteobacteria bacterium]
AWIRTRSNAELREDDVRKFCLENIAHFKVPRYVMFVEEFPMTVTGKLQKFKMREIAVGEMEKLKSNMESIEH